MKKVFYILLGIALIVLTSATSVSVMTVKPALPKSIFTYEFNNYSDAEIAIKKYSKSGYVLKSIVTNGSQYTSYYQGFLVMERY
jgi:hypothetical protein